MTRSLPPRPSLESDKRRAKALKKAHAAGDPEAFARIRAHHPRLRGAGDAEIAAAPLRLADAQLVVAREYGIASWPRLAAIVAFLRADFAERARMLLEAAAGEWPRRARDLLAHSPDLARASLQTACAVADEGAARAWLARDPAAATRRDGPLGAPPLWTLCWSNLDAPADGARAEIATALLAAGADPNATAPRETHLGRHEPGALYGAVHHDRPALAKALLEAGADPNDGESLYHASEWPNARCLALLLGHGARAAGTNALKRALDKPAPEPVRRLLEAGDDPNATGPGPGGRGQTALHHAAFRGQGPAVLDLLVRHGAALDATDEAGHTAYAVARRSGHQPAAEHLLALGADGALAPRDHFVAACAEGDEATARALLAGHPGLMEALDARDHAALPRAAEYGRTRAVALMLDLGFPLEAQDGDFHGTALNHAAHMGHRETLELLLARGADPEIENQFGGNAVAALCFGSAGTDAAATFAAGRSEERRQADLVACVDALVAAGARIRGGGLAIASESVAEALRRHGALEESEG